MAEGGIGVEEQKPKTREEEMHERHEAVFRGEIRESFDNIVASLKRMGLVSDQRIKEPPYRYFSNTGKQVPVDLKDLPTPVDAQSIVGEPVLRPKMDDVDIKFWSGDPSNNLLQITWKGPGYEESIVMHGYRPGHQGLHPEFSWSLNAQDRGKNINLSKQFLGKLAKSNEAGKPSNEFSDKNYSRYGWHEQVPVHLKRLTDALDAKAKQIPHPNPVARFFGK